jgi:hypothetical protein
MDVVWAANKLRSLPLDCLINKYQVRTDDEAVRRNLIDFFVFHVSCFHGPWVSWCLLLHIKCNLNYGVGNGEQDEKYRGDLSAVR